MKNSPPSSHLLSALQRKNSATPTSFITLSEAAEGKYTPIPDPFLYKSQEDYDKVMSVIKVYLTLYATRLEEKLKP